MDFLPVPPVGGTLREELQGRIDGKTKPSGSLGALEKVALQIGLIQESLSPTLQKPRIIVFAGDHGIAKEGVSAFPQEVTYQMVHNFLNGGAAINVFARHSGMDLCVVDAGVNGDFANHTALIHKKIRPGTSSFLTGQAMSREECERAMHDGASLAQQAFQEGCNIIGFGEMGIGNTSSAAVLMSLLGPDPVASSLPLPIEDCVGSGTGLDSDGIAKKRQILERAIAHHNLDGTDPLRVLSTFGGFEIAMMTGAMLQAARNRMVILVDGFIATSAFLSAVRMAPGARGYGIFSHRSHERGHRKMLEILQAEPVLDLNLRLGEGTGAALAYPIVKAAVAFLNEMASFEEAGVSNRE